jgi:hypothetical protein
MRPIGPFTRGAAKHPPPFGKGRGAAQARNPPPRPAYQLSVSNEPPDCVAWRMRDCFAYYLRSSRQKIGALPLRLAAPFLCDSATTPMTIILS